MSVFVDAVGELSDSLYPIIAKHPLPVALATLLSMSAVIIQRASDGSHGVEEMLATIGQICAELRDRSDALATMRES